MKSSKDSRLAAVRGSEVLLGIWVFFRRVWYGCDGLFTSAHIAMEHDSLRRGAGRTSEARGAVESGDIPSGANPALQCEA
jgi:hypothetical protein